MQVLDVHNIKSGTIAEADLYHESGVEIFHKGDDIRQTEKDLLLKHGIMRLFRPESDTELGHFLKQARNLQVKVDDLAEGKALSRPLYDTDGTLLLKENAPVTPEVKARLKSRRVTTVHIKKSKEERRVSQIEGFQRDVAALRQEKREFGQDEPWDSFEDLDDDDFIEDPAHFSQAAIDRNIQDYVHLAAVTTDPMRDQIIQVDPRAPRSDATKARFENTYREAIERVFGVLDDLRHNHTIQGERVGQLAKVVINRLVEDRSLTLNLTNLKSIENYETNHAINVTLTSTSIGAAMGLGRKQVLELAYAAFLHDVGMLKIPQHILGKTAKLTSVERMEIDRHPIYGLNALETISSLPSVVPLVVYQEHERMNKSGYPKQRPGNLIHRYARIIAVADIYDALTSPRPWRPAFLPYEAMEAMLRMVSKKQLDSEVMRAFLSFAGLFPVGSYVKLSDGTIAKVVQANPKRFTKPRVRVVCRDDARSDEQEFIDLMRTESLDVVKPLAADQVPGAELMLGF